MIRAVEIVCLAWLVGVLVTVWPTTCRLARLRREDPALMCEGCRMRRHSMLSSPDPAAVYALLEVFSAPIEPIGNWLRRMVGKPPMLPCAGLECVAHPRYRAP